MALGGLAGAVTVVVTAVMVVLLHTTILSSCQHLVGKVRSLVVTVVVVCAMAVLAMAKIRTIAFMMISLEGVRGGGEGGVDGAPHAISAGLRLQIHINEGAPSELQAGRCQSLAHERPMMTPFTKLSAAHRRGVRARYSDFLGCTNRHPQALFLPACRSDGPRYSPEVVTSFCWTLGSRRSHTAIADNPTCARPFKTGWTATVRALNE